MVAISGTAAGRPQEAAGEADRQAAPWHRPEPAYRRGRRPDIPAGLQAWPRRHRVETAERALPVGPVAGLAQGQEPVPHRGLFGAVEDPFADILGHGSRSPDRIHNTDGQPLAYIYSRESKVEARRTEEADERCDAGVRGKIRGLQLLTLFHPMISRWPALIGRQSVVARRRTHPSIAQLKIVTLVRKSE
jgi:hypothetical protein